MAQAKLYTTKTPITAADLLNDRVLPFFAELGMAVLRMLPTGVPNTVAARIATTISSTWRSTTSKTTKEAR